VVKSLFKWMVPIMMTTMVVIPLVHFDSPPSPDLVLSTNQPPSVSSLRSNRYTQIETDHRQVTENAFASIEGYTYRGSIQQLALYDRQEDASFRIIDERSGYLWASSLDYDYFLDETSPLADEDDIGLNFFWQAKLRSPFFLTYYTGITLREEHAFENVRSTLTMTRFQTQSSLGFHVDVSLFLSKIAFRFTVTLDDEGLKVELPFSSIIESGDFKLSSISLYPLLGATKRLRTPGYAVIPDGVGALIRFTDDPEIGVFTKRYFGSDPGLYLSQAEYPLTANMYGLVHGHRQHGLLGIIESGVGHASLTHYGSQVFLDFNFTYVTFNYRTTYIQYLNQAKTSSVNLLQTQPNTISPVMRYQFLTGNEADYVGIGKQFSQWRFQEDQLSLTTNEIPLHLDILGLETKPGLFSRQPVLMTSVHDAIAMVEAIQTNVTSHLNVVYLGWHEGGYSYTAPHFTQWDRRVGSANHLHQWLQNQTETSKTTFHLAVDPYRAYRQGNRYRQQEIIQTIGQEFVGQGAYYHLNATAGFNRLKQAQEALNQLGFSHLAIETIGDFVSSDFGATSMNKDAAALWIKTNFSTIEQAAIYKPMSHLWQAQSLLDLPMYSSQQARFTDTVPLIPIMIQGRRHGFGRAGNFFSNTRNELLRLIDYGLYPAFFLTEASAYQLLDTPSENIFTSRYQDWAPAIQQQYQFVAGALNAVYGQQLIARDILAPGIVNLTFTNGITITINYSGEAWQQGDQMVLPMSYKVIYAS
jgi:hypothetical protein